MVAQPYAIIARSTVCLFVSVIMPVAWSMIGKRRSGVMLWSENAALRSLRDALHDPEYVKAFQRFLVKRFSVENVLFWMEVELFRAVSSGSIMIEGGVEKSSDLLDRRLYHSENASSSEIGGTFIQMEARAIVKRYLIKDAHLELTQSVDESTRRRIERSVEAGICTSDLFDDAQNMVYEYLQRECWHDFLNSNDCRRAMRKVKRQETIRSRLIGAGMIDRSIS